MNEALIKNNGILAAVYDIVQCLESIKRRNKSDAAVGVNILGGIVVSVD